MTMDQVVRSDESKSREISEQLLTDQSLVLIALGLELELNTMPHEQQCLKNRLSESEQLFRMSGRKRNVDDKVPKQCTCLLREGCLVGCRMTAAALIQAEPCSF